MTMRLLSLLTILHTILHRHVVYSYCSFSIDAITATPKRNNTLDMKSPDCDDTAIIINETNPSKSLIVGTLKQGGLELYNLQGELLQHIDAPDPPNNNSTNMPGRFNNVAAIQSLNNPSKTIVIVTDRGLDQLRFYTLNNNNLLYDITNTTIPWVFSTSQQIVNKQQTAYGLTATNYGKTMTVFVSKRHQNIVAKINLIEIGSLISYEIIDIFILPLTFKNGWKACTNSDDENPQIEGMVVDHKDGTLLIAQEIVGLFKTTVNGGNFTLIDTVTDFGVEYFRIYNSQKDEYICIYNGSDHGLGGNIVADAEGISLYMDDEDMVNGGYYVLSVQGANVFNLYSRNSFHFIGNFNIFFENDTVENTDGVEIKNRNFGQDYPKGIIIVQDEGDNDDTNFKIGSFEDILYEIEECKNIYSSTMYYSTTNKIETTKKSDDNGSKGDRMSEGEKMAILILAIVFGVLLIIAIGIYVYFKCKEHNSKIKEPKDYVELGNK